MLPERAPARHGEALRVLHVISGDLWAGAETQVFQLVRALSRRSEVEVRVAVMNPGILADRLMEHGITVDVFDERRESAFRILRRLTRVARDWRPAVVHTHRRKEHILGGLAALLCGARAVATVHGRQEFDHPWWRLRQSLLATLERQVLVRLHRRIVAVSEELVKHLPGPANHKVVIPNGLDVDEIRAKAKEKCPPLPADAGKKLAFLGRLVPVKRVDRIIDAVAILRDREPGQWTLFVIGDGPLQDALQQRIVRAGQAEFVHLLGFVSNPMPWLAQMDALVFASEHEGLPMTALEALALGVSVISPPIGGLVDLVRDAGLGRVAVSSDPKDLAAAIRAAVGDRLAAQDASTSAVPTRNTTNHSVEQFYRIYAYVAAKGSHS